MERLPRSTFYTQPPRCLRSTHPALAHPVHILYSTADFRRAAASSTLAV